VGKVFKTLSKIETLLWDGSGWRHSQILGSKS
jgi:hypothetical protein